MQKDAEEKQKNINLYLGAFKSINLVMEMVSMFGSCQSNEGKIEIQ